MAAHRVKYVPASTYQLPSDELGRQVLTALTAVGARIIPLNEYRRVEKHGLRNWDFFTAGFSLAWVAGFLWMAIALVSFLATGHPRLARDTSDYVTNLVPYLFMTPVLGLFGAMLSRYTFARRLWVHVSLEGFPRKSIPTDVEEEEERLTNLLPNQAILWLRVSALRHESAEASKWSCALLMLSAGGRTWCLRNWTLPLHEQPGSRMFEVAAEPNATPVVMRPAAPDIQSVVPAVASRPRRATILVALAWGIVTCATMVLASTGRRRN